MSGTVKGSGRTYDPSYRQAISDAVTAAIFTSSVTESDGQRVSYIRSAEVVDALISQIAYLTASSPETEKPSDRRKLCDELRQKLYRQIGATREAFARDGGPFDFIVPGQAN